MPRKRILMKRLIGLTALSATLVACGAPSSDTFRISGSGATFPAPFYTRTFSDFNKDTGNQVNYQATGSGSGVRQFFASTILPPEAAGIVGSHLQ